MRTPSLLESLTPGMVLEQLGLEEVEALPTRQLCPVCREPQLQLYPQDNTSPYGWHYCFGCQAGGDWLQLLGRHWGLGLEATLTKLGRLAGLTQPDDESRQRYRRHRRRHSRAIKILQLARPRTLDPSGSQQELLERYELSCPMSPERRAAGPALLWGLADKVEIESILQPRSCSQEDVGHNHSRSRPFRGRGWRDVIVVPRFLTPGQPVAFDFYGRQAGPEDHVLRQVVQLGGVTAQRELGLVGLEGVGQAETLVALEDTLRLLKLQARHFRSGWRPLPLVGWSSGPAGRTARAWDTLRERRVVFWAPTPTRSLLEQLVFSEQELWLEPRPNWGRLLSDAGRRGRPWREALGLWLRDKPDRQVEQVLLWLEQLGEPVTPLSEYCDELPRLLDRSARPRTIDLDGRQVVERGGGWYLQPGGRRPRCILSAILRIDEQCEYQDLGKTLYRGRLLYRQQQLPFAVEAPALEQDPARWLSQLLVQNSLGPLHYDAGWSRRLVRIATALQPPRIHQESGRVGYSPAAGLRLPHVQFVPLAPARVHTPPPWSAPASRLVVGGPPPRDVLRESLTNPNAPLRWQLWLLLVGKILHGPFRYTHRGLVVSPPIEPLRQVARDLGCPLPSSAAETRSVLQELHAWPLVSSDWLVLHDVQHSLLLHNRVGWLCGCASRQTAAALVLQHDWTWFDQSNLARLDDLPGFDEVGPCYWSDLASRGYRPQGDLRQDVQDWLDRLGLDLRLPDPLRVLEGPRGQARVLWDLITARNTSHGGPVAPGLRRLEFLDSGHVRVSPAALEGLWSHDMSRAPRVDAQHVTRLWEKAGWLVGEDGQDWILAPQDAEPQSPPTPPEPPGSTGGGTCDPEPLRPDLPAADGR